MTPSIRPACPADLPAMDRLFRDSFIATFGHLYAPTDLAAFLADFTPAAWQAEFESPAFAFQVGQIADEIVGYCKLGPVALPHTEAGGAIELRQLYLRADAHGSGLAQALMEWAIGEARLRGATRIYLSVFTDNHRARRFYARYGFQELGPYAFMVGTHADEDIVMRLSL